MPHHFTKSTVQANCWCNACNRETPWRIVDGRRSYCLTCYEQKGGVPTTIPEKTADPQGDLFK